MRHLEPVSESRERWVVLVELLAVSAILIVMVLAVLMIFTYRPI